MRRVRSLGSRWRQRPGYRGEDRRPGVITGEAVTQPWWVAAGLTLGGLIVASVVLVLIHRLGPMAPDVVVGVRSAAVVLAAVLAVVARLYWRATGKVTGGRISTGAWLLTGAVLTGLLADETGVALPAALLGLALTVTGAAWFVWALLGPEVDTTARPDVELGVALAGAGLGWGLLLALVPWSPGVDAVAVVGMVALLAGLTWLVVAVVALVRAVAGASLVMGWVAWLAVGLMSGQLARFGALVHTPDWMSLVAAATSWGLLLATLGLASSLGRSVVDGRQQLHAAALYERAREQAASDRDRGRAHEIRNALFAIEGATSALERYGDRLSTEDRAELGDAITRGISHLRRVVDPDPGSDDSRSVTLWDLAAGRAALVRARGVTVRVAGDREALAAGDTVLCGQIIDNLLTNAVRHGNGEQGGIDVRVEQVEDEVRLEVRDRGPGVPVTQQERIFDTGIRLDDAREGEGLGLSLARALARRQGGALWLAEDNSAEGACFVLSLPRAGVVGESPLADGLEDGGEVVEPADTGTSSDRERAAAPSEGIVVQHDDDLSIYVDPARGDDRDVEALRRGGGDEGDLDPGRHQ